MTGRSTCKYKAFLAFTCIKKERTTKREHKTLQAAVSIYIYFFFLLYMHHYAGVEITNASF